MTSGPLVSVIIPCYNQGRYLADAFQSILLQSHSNWECIIVNDGSTDNTEEVALLRCNSDKRFKYHKKKNGGLSSARNAGLRIAQGEFIQFLDSDDKLCQRKLESNLAFLTAHIRVDIVYSGARYFYSAAPEKYLIIRHKKTFSTYELTMYDDNVLDIIRVKNPFVVSAPLYRKAVFDVVGGYDEELRSLEDWDFQIRCAKQGLVFHYIGYNPETATLIRLHENSMMTNKRVLRVAEQQLMRKHDISATGKGKEKNMFKVIFTLLMPPVIVKILKRIF